MKGLQAPGSSPDGVTRIGPQSTISRDIGPLPDDHVIRQCAGRRLNSVASRAQRSVGRQFRPDRRSGNSNRPALPD